MQRQITASSSVASPVPAQGRVNILFVESNVDGTVGGSYLSLFFLAAGLDRKRYRPIVLFGCQHDLLKRFHDAGIDARVARPRSLFVTTSRVLRPFARLANFLTAQLQSVRDLFHHLRLLSREQVHVLHLNNSIEASRAWTIAAILRRTPCVVHERGILERYSPMTRMFGKHLAAVICVSEAVREHLASHGFGHLPMTTVHNGLDASTFRVTRTPESVRDEFGLARTARVVGIVGNMQSWKGQDVVVRAIGKLRAEFPDLVCLLIGDVSQRDPDGPSFYAEVQRLIAAERLGDNVLLTGYRPDVANYINAVEILLHASVKPEPFGRVLLEGMALRKPIVASRAGGVTEIVLDGETGLLYEPGDSDELATHLRRLLRDERLRLAMGEAGHRRLVECFNVDKNVAATEQIYRSILSPGS